MQHYHIFLAPVLCIDEHIAKSDVLISALHLCLETSGGELSDGREAFLAEMKMMISG